MRERERERKKKVSQRRVNVAACGDVMSRDWIRCPAI